MTASLEKPVLSKPESEPKHPLDPLSAAEIEAAVSLVKTQQNLGEQVRFISVSLHEPPKGTVLSFESGQPFDREVEMVLLDNASRGTYEAIVSLTANAVTSWKLIPGVQPAIALDEFFECEAAVRADPDFQAALQKRGITDMSLVAIDPWSAGYYGDEPEGDTGRRLVRTLCWVRSHPTDNLYAHPVEGVLAIVDLNAMQVLRVEDHGVVPIPPEDCNYTTEHVKNFRTDLKPLEIVQPEGPSFTVQGQEVRWQKWRMRIGFTPREGLVLHTVGYEDQGQVRPILYRASLAEMTVPYGDPQVQCYRKNAFDVGEYGVGMLANSLTLGCDCLGVIQYFDATLSNSKGEPVIIKNAVCLHEEDYGILWKHMDWRTDQTEVRRSRRLVVSFIATVGNYEYGFFWYFYQDGSIQYEAKLTGMMNTTAVAPDVVPKYGTLIAPQLYAQNHQHIFSVRLDMSVDGMNNSVYEVDTEPAPPEENPYGNAFYAKSTLLKTEQEAQRLIDPFKARYWKVVNPAKTNRMGYPVSYKLVHGENGLPFALPNSSVMKRAGYMTKHLWVTPYDAAERYPAGEYPNQHSGGAGLPQWTAANESVEDTDIVLWYTMAHTHVPRAEDWPVMPTAYIGFMLKPVNFFDLNPANDVPPSVAKHKCH
ncbi:MAG: primary-amine oxidase [Oscillatoriophycideae cyanobacterium NC_groundwater_1537_Pr4_S-0.65um_50_18]|nr:primary-amine oxidase [Oscillatoriophycideae cyanobacterium NC_groundwater_1537_Pr4_S-0.65um_50_18]